MPQKLLKIVICWWRKIMLNNINDILSDGLGQYCQQNAIPTLDSCALGLIFGGSCFVILPLWVRAYTDIVSSSLSRMNHSVFQEVCGDQRSSLPSWHCPSGGSVLTLMGVGAGTGNYLYFGCFFLPAAAGMFSGLSSSLQSPSWKLQAELTFSHLENAFPVAL